MNALVMLAVPLAAAAGGLLRWFIAGRLDTPQGLPVGTWLVNLTGSAAIGALAGGFARWQIPLDGDAWLLVAGAGLGSFTTVSAFALHTVVLFDHQLRSAAIYVAATMLLCPLAAVGGFLLVFAP
jgi:CrcB protein